MSKSDVSTWTKIINRVKSGILWINIKVKVLFVIKWQVLPRFYWTRNLAVSFDIILSFHFICWFCQLNVMKSFVRFWQVLSSRPRERNLEPGTWNLEPALRQSVNSSITVNENSGNCCSILEQVLVKCTRVLFCLFLWSMVLINAICRKFYNDSV